MRTQVKSVRNLAQTYFDTLPYHRLISRDNLPSVRLEELGQIRPWPRHVTHFQHDTGFWFIPSRGFSYCANNPLSCTYMKARTVSLAVISASVTGGKQGTAPTT
jgi:hypothetical protein